MELDDRARRALLDAFDRSDWQEMTVTVGPDTLRVSRAARGNGTPAPAGLGARAVVRSPSVGRFRRASSATDRPFVGVGDRVAAGDTLALVEVARRASRLGAPVAGAVTAILVDDGAGVEHGQALVTIDPGG